MVDALRVYGVPEEVSDGTEIVREQSVVYPVVNPLPEEQPNPGMSAADANAALLDLATRDGWAGLYNPGDASTVTLDVNGKVYSVADAMGNLPDLVVTDGEAFRSTVIGTLGALGTLSGTSTDSFLADFGAPGSWGALAPLGEGAGLAWREVDSSTSSGYGRLLGAARGNSAGGFTEQTIDYRATPAQALLSATELACPVGGVVVCEQSAGPSNEGPYVGVIPVVPDDDEADQAVRQIADPMLPSQFILTRRAEVGPMLVSKGAISGDVRARANRLLEQLGGIPASVADPEGAIPSGYVVQDEDGNVLAQHRPDRPEQLASVTKVWTCALAYQVLSTQSGWSPDDLVTMVPSYVGDTVSKYPWVDPGDQMTYRDAFHASLMVSHNIITDAIATAAGELLVYTGVSDPIEKFVMYMNDQAQAMGWTEAVFTTPQGRYDSILTPRHVADMWRWVEVNVPFVFDVAATHTWDWDLIYANPVDPEEPVLTGTWNSWVPAAVGSPLPELVAGKTGDTPAPTIRTISAVSENPLANLNNPSRWYSVILNTSRNHHHRYRLLRNIWTAVETFNAPPEGWSVSRNAQLTWVPYTSNESYAAAFRTPGEEGGFQISPFDPASQALPRIESGDQFYVQVSAFRGSVDYPVRLEAVLQGGLWESGSDTLTVDMTTGGGFQTLFLSGVARKGGIVLVRLVADTEDPMATIGMRSVTLRLTLSEQILTYYDMDLVDYRVQENAQSVDASDLSGAVGDFSASCVRPESGSVIQMFGSNWLKGRDAQVMTQNGNFRGVVTQVSETDEATLSISAASVMQRLVAQQAVGEAFSGPLEELIFSYLGQVEGLPGVVEIDPSFIGIPVTAPSWRGELWQHVKMLGAAYGFNLRVDGFKVIVEPVPRSVVTPFQMISNQEQLEDGQEARYVEVVRKSGQVVSEGLVYPPGGWSDDAEVITVGGGETVTIELQTETSLLSVQQPVPVDRVEKMETNRSVYSIVDDHGNAFPAGRWTELGGNLRVEISPDGNSVFVTIQAPDTIWIGGSTGADNYIRSFTIGSLRSQGTKQFSTLRILGSGVGVSETILRVPTGLTNAVTEVGTRIDNPFVTSMKTAAELGTRAALKYGGFRPGFQTGTAHTPLGETVNGDLHRDSYNYRILSATHTPGGTSFTAEYEMHHDDYSALYPGATYGDIQTEMDPYTYWDDQVIGKRRP